ncbi:MAG: hypothetical protein FWC64_11685, partial [Treponema sp.]|nr:hypothetical protein [Treponema sp.]
NRETLNLLRELEGLGLIRLQNSVSKDITQEGTHSNRWLRGCCKSLPKGSVNEFLARCRADKDRELATESLQG